MLGALQKTERAEVAADQSASGFARFQNPGPVSWAFDPVGLIEKPGVVGPAGGVVHFPAGRSKQGLDKPGLRVLEVPLHAER